MEYNRADQKCESSSSSISTAAIQAIVEDLKLLRHRNSTRENYYRIWKIFNEFFIRLDCRPRTWEDRIILFAGYLIINRKKSSTINCYISAIKSVLLDIGIEVSEDRVLLASLTKACKLNLDMNYNRLPIKKGMIHLLIKSVNKLFDSQPYLRCLYQAMLVTMYYGLFRIGEITASPHVVKAKNIFVGVNKNKLMFILYSSKTHSKSNKPQVIKISGISKVANAEKLKYCPFDLMKKYSAIRPEYRSNSEQYFVYGDNSAVTPQLFRKVFKQLLEDNNFDMRLYSCLGIRAGRASDLLEMGVSVKTIHLIGRWKSNAVYSYFKH